MLELGRWGLNFYSADYVADISPIWLANALRVVLQPPAELTATVQLHSEGVASWIRFEDGGSSAGRGEAIAPDLTISGPPPAIVAGMVVGNSAGVPGVEIEGDEKLLDELRGWVVIPERLREEAQMMVESGALLIAATEAAAASA